ncbi:hypothetical protein SAMN05428966_10165 [Massilia sp. PDC64]|nr:hypothetical protein [Massilia sp. PDC64]SDC08574.1 hypothetical protein SAMN05428966_10165 [Massilia sp. PDC64]
MSVNKVDSENPRFNYLVCLDIVVLACILVVAGRPDGLAITVSAIIIATGAVVYRCSVGVKSYMAAKAQTDAGELDRSFSPPPPRAPAERPTVARGKSTSWLREDD